MNMAVFFQKHENKIIVAIFKKLYMFCRCRSNAGKIRYLRQCGAKIGEGCYIASISMLGSEPYLVEIGDGTCITGFSTKILTHDGSASRLSYMGLTPNKYDYFGKVKIGKNCFIGFNSIIMKNVCIGDNCIIGAGSVVTKSIPANSVACGVPARVICTVEEYFEKNHERFDETLRWNKYKKRQYIEENMAKYDAWLMESIEKASVQKN